MMMRRWIVSKRNWKQKNLLTWNCFFSFSNFCNFFRRKPIGFSGFSVFFWWNIFSTRCFFIFLFLIIPLLIFIVDLWMWMCCVLFSDKKLYIQRYIEIKVTHFFYSFDVSLYKIGLGSKWKIFACIFYGAFLHNKALQWIHYLFWFSKTK